jgi:hypothetical protein
LRLSTPRKRGNKSMMKNEQNLRKIGDAIIYTNMYLIVMKELKMHGVGQ